MDRLQDTAKELHRLASFRDRSRQTATSRARASRITTMGWMQQDQPAPSKKPGFLSKALSKVGGSKGKPKPAPSQANASVAPDGHLTVYHDVEDDFLESAEGMDVRDGVQKAPENGRAVRSSSTTRHPSRCGDAVLVFAPLHLGDMPTQDEVASDEDSETSIIGDKEIAEAMRGTTGDREEKAVEAPRGRLRIRDAGYDYEVCGE